MLNTIVVGLKERKQKARSIILEADKQIKEAALEFADSASKTRFLAAVDKAKDNLLTALEDITDIPP
jgi:hypothetical protein